YFTRLLGSHYNGESLHPQYTTPPPQVQGSSQFQERQEWATMVKSFAYPEDPKRKKFKKMQEAARKDVERAFGVLQARRAIVRGAARFWHRQKLKDIMYACVILHNMIVENEGNAIST
ncbi:hypothetical protein LINPERHAP2_LOCUS6058, partial [Linum perenne]